MFRNVLKTVRYEKYNKGNETTQWNFYVDVNKQTKIRQESSSEMGVKAK